MWRRKSVFLLLISVLGSVAQGSVQVRLEAWQAQAPIQPEAPEIVRQQQRIEIDFDQSWSGETLSLVLRPRLEGLSRDDGSGTSRIEPRESVLAWEPGSVGFSLGFLTPVWEGTDGINPMDIASVRDLRDPLRSVPRASPGLGMTWSPGDLQIEMFWIPRQTPALLPGVNSHWYPRGSRLLLASDEIELRLPDETAYRFEDNEILDKALEHNFGARVQGSADAWEWAVGFFEGAAQTPMIFAKTLDVTPIELDPRQIFLLQSPVRLSRVDYRRRTGAARLVWSAESWIIRVAFRHDEALGEDPRKPGWSQLGVGGVEKNFFWDASTLTVLLQGGWGKRQQQDETLLSVDDLLNRSVMAGVRWAPGESDQFYLAVFRETHQGGTFGSLEYQHRWSDRWSSFVAIEMIEGDEGSYLGLLRDRDRAKLGLTASF